MGITGFAPDCWRESLLVAHCLLNAENIAMPGTLTRNGLTAPLARRRQIPGHKSDKPTYQSEHFDCPPVTDRPEVANGDDSVTCGRKNPMAHSSQALFVLAHGSATETQGFSHLNRGLQPQVARRCANTDSPLTPCGDPPALCRGPVLQLARPDVQRDGLALARGNRDAVECR
jgi:hypothetical protein